MAESTIAWMQSLAAEHEITAEWLVSLGFEPGGATDRDWWHGECEIEVWQFYRGVYFWATDDRTVALETREAVEGLLRWLKIKKQFATNAGSDCSRGR